jgi:hypothetical protein
MILHVYRLQIDIDYANRADVVFEAKRLKSIAKSCGIELGKYVIRKSSDAYIHKSKYGIENDGDGKWHLLFPDSRLSKDEELMLLLMSRAHKGFVYYSITDGDTTIRIDKKGKVGMKPYTVEVGE